MVKDAIRVSNIMGHISKEYEIFNVNKIYRIIAKASEKMRKIFLT